MSEERSETSLFPVPTSLTVIFRSRSNVQILRIDHHNGEMSPESTFRLPEGFGFLKADGQGRIIGFLVQKFGGPPRVILVNLDHPGLIAESQFLPNFVIVSNYCCSRLFCDCNADF